MSCSAYSTMRATPALSATRLNIRDVFERGADFLVEYRVTVPDEPLRWVECKGQMIPDAAGNPVRFSDTAIDVTERRRTADELTRLVSTLEQRLAERTDELNFFWETSPDLLVMIDFDGVFKRVNPATWLLA